MNSPATILFVSEYAGFLGGIEQYVFQVARLLRREGYRLELLYAKTARDTEAYLDAFDAAATSSNQLSPEPKAVILHRIWNTDLAEELLKRFGDRLALLVHDHEVYCPRSYYYSPFGRTNCTRAYSQFRCGLCGSLVSPRHWQSGLPAFLRSRFTEFQQRFLLAKRIPHCIVLSEFMQNNLVRNGFDRRRIMVLPPVVPVPQNSPTPSEKHFKNSPPLIGFVGQLIRGKGADTFLDILMELAVRGRPFRAVIVGDGSDRSLLEKRLKETGLHVDMPGFVPNPHEWYDRCDIMLLPFRWQEPFGLVGAEAAAHALPVVASDLGGVHAWMIPGKTGMTAPAGNIPAFADALCTLLDSPSLCAQMGLRAREYASKTFSETSFLAAFENVLRQFAPDTIPLAKEMPVEVRTNETIPMPQSEKRTDEAVHSSSTKENTPIQEESPTTPVMPVAQPPESSPKPPTPVGFHPLRILVDTLPFDHGQSGISEYNRAVISALEEAGHDVTVLSIPDTAHFFPESKVVLAPAWAKSAIGSIIYHLFSISKLLRPSNYDFCLVGAANRRFPLSSAIPVFGVIHDLGQCRNKKQYGALHNIYLDQILARLVRRAATRVIAVSQATFDDIVEFWHIPSAHISLNPNGLSLPKHDETGFLEKYGLEARHYILFVSRIAANKNHRRLVKAYEKLPPELLKEHKLVFVGSNEGWGDPELEKMVQESPCKDNIIFTGYIPDAFKAEAYRCASLHVFPSQLEGFGFPLIEAMHYGCPCCCSNNSSLGEFGKGAALLFDPTDVDAIRDAMQTILEDRDNIREKLIQAGLRKVCEFSWKHHAEKIIQLYESIKAQGEENA